MLPFLLGIVIAYICGPAVSFFYKKFNWSVKLSAVFLIICIYFFVILLMVKIVPSVYKSLIEIVNKIIEFDLHKTSQDIVVKFKFIMLNEHIIEGINELKQSIISKIPIYLNSTANALVSSTQSIISIVFSLVFAPIISFYFLSDLYFKKFDVKAFFGSNVFNYMNHLAKHFIQIQTLMVSIYFVYYLILMSILGLNNALTLSIICGISYIIPYVGPIIGLVLCILVSVIQYGVDHNILILTIGFIGIGIADTAFISPRFIGPKFGLHPLLTIFSILTSASFFGLIGMLFAIPLAVIMKDIAKTFFSYRE